MATTETIAIQTEPIKSEMSGAPDRFIPILGSRFDMRLHFNVSSYAEKIALVELMESRLKRGAGVSWTWTFGFNANTVLWVESTNLPEITEFLKFIDEYNTRQG